VDQTYLEQLDPTIPRNRRTLAVPKQITGIGRGVAPVTELVDLPIYLPSVNGQLATFTRTFHVFPKLGTPILIGGDILEAEKIDLLHGEVMIINSCGGLRIRTYTRAKARV